MDVSTVGWCFDETASVVNEMSVKWILQSSFQLGPQLLQTVDIPRARTNAPRVI